MQKKSIVTIVSFTLISTLTQAQVHKKSKSSSPLKRSNHTANNMINLSTENDSLSYAIGISMAKFYKSQGIEQFNTAVLNKALNDGMSNSSTPLMSDETAQNVMMTTARKMMAKKADATKKEGADFLAKNKLKDSVVVLPNGLQYKILKAGNGPKPKADDKVKVNYMGMLIDGTEFDNSYKRGEPLDIEVNGVIKGWTEALQLMPKGSKWRLYIPSDLAYGDRQAGEIIKAGSTLIFDVELLDILPPSKSDSTNENINK